MPSGQTVEAELEAAVNAILRSPSRKKLIVAGPGTGKTFIFKKLLSQTSGSRDTRLVLTFIRNLTADLGRDLGALARVSTLHGYCQSLLHRVPEYRGRLTEHFKCIPGLATLIDSDWKILKKTNAPDFVKGMRDLLPPAEIGFYFDRADYYDAVDFDDSVFRVAEATRKSPDSIESMDLVLIDEFQDFNAMEVSLIKSLATKSPIVIAGDDDQALYTQLKGASWDHIRSLHSAGEYEVFNLPFCMRCPEVVVGAVNDVVEKARALRKLAGRIEKPYRHYPPKKGEDSHRYPKITIVQSSVQTSKANYLGRFVVTALRSILQSEIDESAANHEPTALVIGAKHYLTLIGDALTDAGFVFEAGSDQPKRIDRIVGIEILSEDSELNVGWRIILEHAGTQLRADAVRRAIAESKKLGDVLPAEVRQSVLEEVAAFQKSRAAQASVGAPVAPPAMRIKLTSFEGSKGLSAQHVFLVGLQAGVLPRKADPADIEVCRFLVGMTRTKKRCCILHTKWFASAAAAPSLFIGWIKPERCDRLFVDAAYWKRTAESPSK